MFFVTYNSFFDTLEDKLVYPIPGLTKEDLKAEVDEDFLVITGESSVEGFENDLKKVIYVGKVKKVNIEVKNGVMIITKEKEKSKVKVQIS